MKKWLLLLLALIPGPAFAVSGSITSNVSDLPYNVSRSTNTGTTPTVAKSSPGVVKGWQITNTSNGYRFLKLYNTAAAPTVGTTVPRMTIGLSTGAVTSQDIPYGIWFSSGISYGATTGLGDGDTGAPGTGDVILNLFYR